MSETIRVAKGVDGSSVRLSVQTFSANGGYTPAAGQFDGTEPLVCQVWPGGDRAQVATLPVTFAGPDDDTPFDPDDPLVLVEFPAETIDLLDSGVYKTRTLFDDLTAHLVDFNLDVFDGPGSGAARPAYHTYKQLRDECPWIDRLSDHLHDETGFADAAADARDWIDDCILKAAPTRFGPGLASHEWGWTWGGDAGEAARYADALASGGLDLGTPGGSQVVKASVYKTLATLCRRAVGMTSAPADLIATGGRYESMAAAAIISATADFADSTLRSLDLGRTNTRRTRQGG